MAAASTFVSEVTKYLRQNLERRQSDYQRHGRSLKDLGSPSEIARKMVETVLPEPSRWDDLLGPFYTTGKVCQLLGDVSRQALFDRRKRRTLLALETADGELVYPVFQFDDRNQVVAGLAEVLQAFHAGPVDDWTLAGWLVAPRRSLGGKSVIDCLRAGRDHEQVLVLAHDAARRFSR